MHIFMHGFLRGENVIHLWQSLCKPVCSVLLQLETSASPKPITNIDDEQLPL